VTGGKQISGVVPTLKLMAWLCVVAVLVVGTLQATHIHKEWSRPDGPKPSLQVQSGKDAQCVFCLTSHILPDVPACSAAGLFVPVQVVTQPEQPAAAARTSLWIDFIRPPPPTV
jgi:hypothetical protein